MYQSSAKNAFIDFIFLISLPNFSETLSTFPVQDNGMIGATAPPQSIDKVLLPVAATIGGWLIFV